MHYKPRAHHVFLALGVVGSFLAFSPVLTTPFRNDEWYIANFARHVPITLETIVQVSYWELFGDPRFQPFSHLLVFLIHKGLGNAFVLFHLLSWISHAVVGLLIYAIVREVHDDKISASLCAILFVTGYSHFDTVSWTYHIYIIHQTASLLIGFWLVLREPSRLRWWQALIGGMLVGFSSFFYEAGLAIPILIMMAMFWSHYAPHKPNLVLSLNKLFIFSVCVVVTYGAFLGLHLSSVGSQISGRIDAALFLETAGNTVRGLWKQGVVGNLGFPPRHAVGDLFYLQGSKLNILPVFAMVLFFVALTIGFFREGLKRFNLMKRQSYLMLIFLMCAVSYYGIIAIGRFNLYVVTQSRYFYLPDAFLVLVFSWPLAMVGTLGAEKHSHDGAVGIYRPWRMIQQPRIWAICSVCIIAVLNAYHTYGACQEIARITRPVRESIKTVMQFVEGSDHGDQLYVDLVPRHLDNKLFGGTHVALETCLTGSEILTRHVADAQYVYRKPEGIVSNPAFKSKIVNKAEFTLEFDYVLWGGIMTVINTPENTFRIRQLSPRENELLFRLTYHSGDGPREFFMAAQHPRHYVSHVVIQQQDDTLYVVEEGEVIAVREVGRGEVRWEDDTLFLGSRVVFPPQYCYLENFFACVGKAKYDLEGVGIGDLLPDAGLRAPMPALNSDPLYWSTN